MGLGPRQVSTLAIGAINPQMWLVDQDFSVTVTITGNPDEAYITGDVQGFGTDWDSATGILTIEGHPEALLVENTFTIRANKGTQSITKPVLYSVVTPSPVIESFGPLTISKGRRFEHQINISNNPTDVRVTGPWVFLDQETNAEGVLIFGDIPDDKEFTIDSGTIAVVATNSGGEHILTGTANILDYTRFNVRDQASDDPEWQNINAGIRGMAVFGGVIVSGTNEEYNFVNIIDQHVSTGRLYRFRDDNFQLHSFLDFNLSSNEGVGLGLCAEGSPDFDFYHITSISFGSTIRLTERDWYNPASAIRSVSIDSQRDIEDITFGNNRIYTLVFEHFTLGDGINNTFQVRTYTKTGSHSSSDSFDPDIGFPNRTGGICYDDVNDRIYIFTYSYDSILDIASNLLFRCYDTDGNRQTQFDFTPEDGIIQFQSDNTIRSQVLDYSNGNFYVGNAGRGTVTIFQDPNV